jgi:hypothetical protein
LTLNEGRAVEQKQRFYKAVADGLHQRLALRREDLFISSKPFLLPNKGSKSSPGAAVVLQIYG